MDMEVAEAQKSKIYSAKIDIPPQSLPLKPDESLNRSKSFTAYLPTQDVSQSRKVVFDDKAMTDAGDNGHENIQQNGNWKKMKPNFSQRLYLSNSSVKGFSKLPRHHSYNVKRYDTFKTWSGKLDRRFSNLRGKPIEPDDANNLNDTEPESLPALDRYLDALEGPELDTLKASEELVLPEDVTWPFLLRFPISSFGMCLGAGSQAMLWKTLALSPSMSFMNISLTVNIVLWCIAIGVFSLVATIYLLKIIFYFEAVRREYYHPVRINFFFSPWIACLFLAIALPPRVAESIPDKLWYVLMAPILCLNMKIYGQWMLGGERRLSKVANPSNHLAVVGNFVGALLGANIGLKEGPIFFFAVGLAHYTVLFVTLYQRLPTNDTLPKELHPVFFLFIAAPSVACTALAKISGEFGIGARIPYFVAMFLYSSLSYVRNNPSITFVSQLLEGYWEIIKVLRVSFFRGFRFSLAWWAYTFPMAGAAIATIRYADHVSNYSSRILALSLSAISTFTVLALLIKTILNAFVFRRLFPNDIAIAISHKKSKSKYKRLHFPSTDRVTSKSPV